MSKQTEHKLSWLPDALTFTRMLLIPVIVVLILAVGFHKNNAFNAPVWLLFLYLFAAFTDFLDGYLARKWNVSTEFGRMIDPIADKLLVAGCLIALMIVFGPIWYGVLPAMTIIFRDIFVSGVREHAALSNRVLAPTKLAKWKTATEMLAIFMFIIGVGTRSVLPVADIIPTISTNANKIGVGFLWIAAILAVITAFGYMRSAFSESSKA